VKIRKTLIALATAALGLAANAAEFRSADIHNADDYPPWWPSST
jgi:hypothetical protein